jgi:hypothetical protein
MASAIRFTEVINNNGTASAVALRATAISSDDFKWAYAGASGTNNRYVEFYDAQIGADRVATITTGSYDALTGTAAVLSLVTSTVSGVGKYDAPVSGVSTATGSFIINLEHIAIAYLTASGSTNVQYAFKNRCFEFAISTSPQTLQDRANLNSQTKTLSSAFPLRFMSNNRVLNASTSGTVGCIFSFSKLRSAGVILNDQQYVNAGVTGIVSEIYLDTPDNLVLATTEPLSNIIPGF